MFENQTEQQAKEEILSLVRAYCRKFHLQKKSAQEENRRIPYASRVYDEEEMENLVDSALEFWLTSGRYTEEFETKFAQYLGGGIYDYNQCIWRSWKSNDGNGLWKGFK